MGECCFYQSIVAHTSIGYSYHKILYDEKGRAIDYRFLKVNRTYESILGISEEDWIGKKVSELYTKVNKRPNTWKDFHRESFGNNRDEIFRKSIAYKEKYYRIKVYYPKQDHIIFSMTDISNERNETENLQTLFDSVPVQVWYLKNPTTYLAANKMHVDFLGIKSNEVADRSIKELVSGKEAVACIQGNKKVFRQKKEIISEEWLSNSHGEKKLLKIKKIPQFNSEGAIKFIICSAEDITEDYINQKETELQENILYSTMSFTKELLTNNNLKEALANGLEMLGEATKVDRVYYWENHYDEEDQKWLTSQKLEWCLDNVEPQINNPDLQNIHFEESIDFIEILAKNQSFSSHIKDMSDEENTTKQVLQNQGILSILAIPIFVKDEFRGFIGFDSCKIEKDWSEIEISLLNSFVFLYVKAFEKNQLEQEVLQIKDNFFNFFNMIEDLFVVLDLKGNILDINNNVLERLNYSRKELLGESYLIFHPIAEQKKIKQNFKKLVEQKNGSYNVSAITKGGHTFPIETANTKGLWNGESVIFAVAKDITELTRSEDKFSKAFNNSGVSMFISRFKDGEIIEVNEQFLDYMGYTEDEVIGKTTFDLKITSDYENRELFKKQIEIKGKISDLEIKLIRKDKITRTGLTNIVPITIENEECLLSSIIDISDRIENETKILNLSNRDELTNLYNRRFIYDSVEEIIDDYKDNEEPFSVAILDIDNFKEINDRYGHQVGDCVLFDFAQIINENVREYDVVGRYGGEEFIILLNHADIEESYTVLKRVLDRTRETTFTCGENKIKLTFSAGMTSCKEVEKEELSLDLLIGISDRRMYVAKKEGKNKIVDKE